MKKSIISNRDNCYICEMYKGIQTRGTEVHHCIHGNANRRIADQDGLTVRLCNQCHRLLHDKGIHDRDLQETAEKAYLEYYNASIDDFIKRYGKNYL